MIRKKSAFAENGKPAGPAAEIIHDKKIRFAGMLANAGKIGTAGRNRTGPETGHGGQNRIS